MTELVNPIESVLHWQKICEQNFTSKEYSQVQRQMFYEDYIKCVKWLRK